MSAACQYCEDTGSLSKQLTGYFDCTHCGVANERTNFESVAAEAGLLGGSFINAWMIYEIGKAAALKNLLSKIIPLKDKMPPQGALEESDRDWYAYQIGRIEAFEDAAKLLDRVNNYDNPMTASDCADAIRSLKDK